MTNLPQANNETRQREQNVQHARHDEQQIHHHRLLSGRDVHLTDGDEIAGELITDEPAGETRVHRETRRRVNDDENVGDHGEDVGHEEDEDVTRPRRFHPDRAYAEDAGDEDENAAPNARRRARVGRAEVVGQNAESHEKTTAHDSQGG